MERGSRRGHSGSSSDIVSGSSHDHEPEPYDTGCYLVSEYDTSARHAGLITPETYANTLANIGQGFRISSLEADTARRRMLELVNYKYIAENEDTSNLTHRGLEDRVRGMVMVNLTIQRRRVEAEAAAAAERNNTAHAESENDRESENDEYSGNEWEVPEQPGEATDWWEQSSVTGSSEDEANDSQVQENTHDWWLDTLEEESTETLRGELRNSENNRDWWLESEDEVENATAQQMPNEDTAQIATASQGATDCYPQLHNENSLESTPVSVNQSESEVETEICYEYGRLNLV